MKYIRLHLLILGSCVLRVAPSDPQLTGSELFEQVLQESEFVVNLELAANQAQANISHPQTSFDLEFAAGSHVSGASTLSHSLYFNQELAPGDLYITELPPQLSIAPGNLTVCENATKFAYCLAFSNINWAVFKVKSSLAAATESQATIPILSLPSAVPVNLNTHFYSFVF